MTDRQRCATCRHWTATETVGSGIPTKDGTREWTYRVGSCFQHSGCTIAEWSSCWLHKTRVAPLAPQE